jgi:type II secretory pathway component PulM
MVARVAMSFESAAQWVQMSVREEPAVWIGGAVCLAIVVWLVRRR